MSEHFDADLALSLYREMVRIRRFESRAAEHYSAGRIRGFLHLYDGEEAVAAGTMRALKAEDAVVATYREHGHALARGLTMRAVMAELFGRTDGVSRGRGGSMHLFDVSRRFFGGNAIVGGGLPIAVGLALADKLEQRAVVTACYFGDGAVAEGEFHESMNLAALWQLPVLFVCENNGYAMGTALASTEAEMNLVKKAESYHMRATRVDGMDAIAVYERTRELVEKIRAGDGPAFLECETYRFRAHSMFDAQHYRDKGEIADWKFKDPISMLKERLRAREALTDASDAELERTIAAEVDDAVAFAESSPLESVESITEHVEAPWGPS